MERIQKAAPRNKKQAFPLAGKERRMAEFEDKLHAILGDPEYMGQIVSIAMH